MVTSKGKILNFKNLWDIQHNQTYDQKESSNFQQIGDSDGNTIHWDCGKNFISGTGSKSLFVVDVFP
jgi:hypothetical protein